MAWKSNSKFSAVPNAGREIKIPGSKFIIGRGEGCHLRPKSDLISRQHCTIVIGDQKVTVVDGSKNGTFVNEERVDGQREVQPGDKLRLGNLQFEIVIGTTLAAPKKPRSRTSRTRRSARCSPAAQRLGRDVVARGRRGRSDRR